jgi:hypothetical protein
MRQEKMAMHLFENFQSVMNQCAQFVPDEMPEKMVENVVQIVKMLNGETAAEAMWTLWMSLVAVFEMSANQYAERN